ncbi:metallophosphoesterase [Orbus hercynius]|nr:metallophosphoesterase [Orbus hercynius]
MFDIIGDIHGQATKLKQLLIKLGYKKTDQGFTHNEYKVIFVGDFIDRGPHQLETLAIIKEMIDNQNAYAVMGNHEFNAIGWMTPSAQHPDTFLRKHNAIHHKQHKIFLEQLGHNEALHQYWIEWFKSLPLFLDLAHIRVIHACWDNQCIDRILPYLDERHCLKAQYIEQAFDPTCELFEYCETLLKGKEITLPDGVYYQDKEGTTRHRSRIKWWLKRADTLRKLCMIPDAECIKGLEQKIDINLELYQDKKPVFFGHYWFSGKPAILTPKMVCVDYSAALDSGKLVAYRYQGESQLINQHFIY